MELILKGMVDMPKNALVADVSDNTCWPLH